MPGPSHSRIICLTAISYLLAVRLHRIFKVCTKVCLDWEHSRYFLIKRDYPLPIKSSESSLRFGFYMVKAFVCF